MALSDRIYFDGAGVIKTYNPGGHIKLLISLRMIVMIALIVRTRPGLLKFMSRGCPDFMRVNKTTGANTPDFIGAMCIINRCGFRGRVFLAF
jgi:hypothetical protein